MCTLVSARKDGNGQGQPEDTTIITTITTYTRRQARYLSLDGSMGHEYSHSTVIVFPARQSEAKTKVEGGFEGEVPWTEQDRTGLGQGLLELIHGEAKKKTKNE